MSITEAHQEGKRRIGHYPADLLIILFLLLALAAAFGFGMLYEREQGRAGGKEGFWIEERADAAPIQPAAVASPVYIIETERDVPAEAGAYVASKTGSKYHLTTCSGAKRIKEENKVWFMTKEAAEAAGYEPAANCPGI